MGEKITVDCIFKTDGSIRLRRVKIDGSWLPVEQGRQWVDEDGRYVLVMLPGQTIHQLLLRRDTLRWQLITSTSGPQMV